MIQKTSQTCKVGDGMDWEQIEMLLAEAVDYVIDAITSFVETIKKLDLTWEEHNHYPPVLNTAKRYDEPFRKIQPHARSCC